MQLYAFKPCTQWGKEMSYQNTTQIIRQFANYKIQTFVHCWASDLPFANLLFAGFPDIFCHFQWSLHCYAHQFNIAPYQYPSTYLYQPRHHGLCDLKPQSQQTVEYTTGFIVWHWTKAGCNENPGHYKTCYPWHQLYQQWMLFQIPPCYNKSLFQEQDSASQPKRTIKTTIVRLKLKKRLPQSDALSLSACANKQACRSDSRPLRLPVCPGRQVTLNE